MKIHLVLHIVDEDLLLFSGPPAECPPLPRPGDVIIIREHQRVRIEGICHSYRADHLEIGLLA